MSRPRKAATGRDEKASVDAVGKRMQQLHELEMQYVQGASKSDLLIKDEDVRRLKLRILMLRDENTTLRDQITQNSDENAKLVVQCQDLGAQLEAKIALARSQEKQLRKQEREFSSLKAELQNMNDANKSSTNVLTEKLALSRELAVLKPELEHLRSQLTHQQATLAEKLALERQVNTLEVELANEKKATKRAMHKRESTDRVEDDLRKKLRESEKQLVAERAQRERLEDQLAQEKRTHQLALQDQDSTRELESDLRKKLQEAQQKLRTIQEENERLGQELNVEKRHAHKRTQNSQDKDNSELVDELRARLEESDAKLAASQKQAERVRNDAQSSIDEADRRSAAFEKKFEKLKTKFRELQDQWKQCQAELKVVQKPKPAMTEEIDMRSLGRQVFKKRKAEDISRGDFTQITIATPGADDKPRKMTKKKAVEPSLVGEKSTFSITPFLNRAKNLAVDEDADEDEAVDMSYIPRDKTSPAETVKTAAPVPVEAETSDSSSEPSSALPELQLAEKQQTQPKPRGRPKKVLGEAPSVRKNTQPVPKTALKKTSKIAKTLEKVTKEGQENMGRPVEKAQAVKFNFTMPQDTSLSSVNTSKTEEPKKKKRKMLGSTKTLFDDDEEAVAPAASNAASKAAPLGGARKRAQLGGGVRNAFAGSGFSPLKRDKRGVGASFLA